MVNLSEPVSLLKGKARIPANIKFIIKQLEVGI